MSYLKKSAQKAVPSLLVLTAQSQYNNRDVVKYYSNMTIQRAFKSDSLGIGQLAKQDESKAILCITNLFKATALYFDASLSHNQAELIAVEILSKYEYRSLKLEDILTICIRIKEAEIYKFTVARIMREIKNYSLEREKLAMRFNSGIDQSNINLNLEERIKKHFKILPNSNKISNKRSSIKNKFK